MVSRRNFLYGTGAGLSLLSGCVDQNMTGTGGRDDQQEDANSGDEGSPEANAGEASIECDTTVRIEGEAMEPNLSQGVDVCIVEYDSYEPVDDPEISGVIPAEVGEEIGYEHLGGAGDIIRYFPDGDEDGNPVIARAISWEDGSYVTQGDNNNAPYPWDAPVDSIIGVVERVAGE